MKVMNVRRVALLLLVAFVVAIAVGAVLPKPVMAEVTSVLTGSVVHADVWDGGCLRYYDHSIPGHWEYGVWIPIEVVQVCYYRRPCPIE